MSALIWDPNLSVMSLRDLRSIHDALSNVQELLFAVTSRPGLHCGRDRFGNILLTPGGNAVSDLEDLAGAMMDAVCHEAESRPRSMDIYEERFRFLLWMHNADEPEEVRQRLAEYEADERPDRERVTIASIFHRWWELRPWCDADGLTDDEVGTISRQLEELYRNMSCIPPSSPADVAKLVIAGSWNFDHEMPGDLVDDLRVLAGIKEPAWMEEVKA